MQQDNSQSSSLRDDLLPTDQACNECRRRKAKCDKVIPQCGPCAKNRRHCLYERHSKTPLTRRYLTEVEERLRTTEIRAREAERRAELAKAQLRELLQNQDDYQGELHVTSTALHSAAHTPGPGYPPMLGSTNASAEAVLEHSDLNNPSNLGDTIGVGRGVLDELNANSDANVEQPTIPLEAPPAASGDFSWDEQTPKSEEGIRTSTTPHDEEDERVVDGMASLTIDEQESGYLGIASGAAMLRLLLPAAERRKEIKGGYKRSIPLHSPTPEICSRNDPWIPTPIWDRLKISSIDLDSMIDAYFNLSHISYPIVHESTFRAQYAQVIPRPSGTSWNALAYMMAATGAFTAGQASIHRDLFMAAKSNISIDSLETGNITLIQCLALMSNYLQKCNKPNSGYNYRGLALHMAMGLGLHKEFKGWKISPLDMEMRRRVWWCLFVFSSGANVTFGRPLAWPHEGVEVALPLNINDRDLTSMSRTLPPAIDSMTIYSALILKSKFYLAANQIYTRIIAMPFPSAAELLRLDDTYIGAWLSSLPPWYQEYADVPTKFRTAHCTMWGRLHNFRIIMYRPFVIGKTLLRRTVPQHISQSSHFNEAHDRCLKEAKLTIDLISNFWSGKQHTRMGAWYALYFLFQASLIPCVCLRNEPSAPQAPEWRDQIKTTLGVIQAMRTTNPSAQDCYDVIVHLCGSLVNNASSDFASIAVPDYPTQESPQTQINSVPSMTWPNDENFVDTWTQDAAWSEFLGVGLAGSGATTGNEPGLDPRVTGGYPWIEEMDTFPYLDGFR